MRVLVCGGRAYRNRRRVYDELDGLDKKKPIALIIEGGATGADMLARQWAEHYHTAVVSFPADWQRHARMYGTCPDCGAPATRTGYCRLAGFIRNQQMLAEGKPNLVVAFPGGNGTTDMVRRARRAAIPVRLVDEESPYPLLKRAPS